MKLSDIRIGQEIMVDVFGKVTAMGVDAWGKEYIELELTKDKRFYGTVKVSPDWCWMLESRVEKVSPNQHEPS